MRFQNLTRSRGFNLIEVMVALVVISVGLLGIAKMQALAMASTGTAKMRSLAALEAASLASTMRADRAYWTAIVSPFVVTFQNGSIVTATDAALMGVNSCTSAASPCTNTQITAFDLQDWGASLAAQMPFHTAVLNCTQPPAPAPVSCTILINWTENQVAMNSQSAAQPVLATSYKLYVEP